MDNFCKIACLLLLLNGISYADQAADRALFDAIEAGNLQAVKEALKNGASVDAKDEHRMTPFSKALYIYSMSDFGPRKTQQNANKDVVYEIFNHITTITPDDFVTAVTAKGLRDLVEKMIAKGISVDVRDTRGRTALMDLVQGYPDLEDVKFLVEKGANVNAMDKKTFGGDRREKSVLDYALSPGSPEALKAASYLIDKGAQVTPHNFVRAAGAHQPDLELIKKMYQKVGDIDAVDANGQTALRAALQFGGNSKAVINYLLDNNANVNAMAPEDPTSPLLIALGGYYGFPESAIDLEIIEKMLKLGANIDEKVMAFARGDFKEAARLLGPEGEIYKQYPQPDATKKTQVIQLLQKYKK